jgi:ABC-type nickel/cobalt efflux system permease component RcnA
MESFTGLFSNLSETLTTNFMPIAVVLVLVLLVTGWLVYKSFTGSKPEPEHEPEPEAEHESEQKQEVEETPDKEGFEQESEN